MSSNWYAPDGSLIEDPSPLRDYPKTVERTKVHDATVSTVWLGLDHGRGDGPPLIFESMIFGGPRDQDCYRYSTMGEAKAGHARLVDELTKQGPWCEAYWDGHRCRLGPQHTGPHESEYLDEIYQWKKVNL